VGRNRLISSTKLPQHLAIIMDGNGRWAQKRGLKRHDGHRQGSKTAENIISYCSELGIRYVTLYAFSSENWQRPKEEVDAIMILLQEYLEKETSELKKRGIKISTIGQIDRLPDKLQNSLKKVLKDTANGSNMELILALSYGSWQEIAEAFKNVATHIKNEILKPKDINKNTLRKYLYTKDVPDPDLFIRSGGEERLSNFLLMQLSYCELYFCPKLWPDFSRADLDEALKNFSARTRRFGCI